MLISSTKLAIIEQLLLGGMCVKKIASIKHVYELTTAG